MEEEEHSAALTEHLGEKSCGRHFLSSLQTTWFESPIVCSSYAPPTGERFGDLPRFATFCKFTVFLRFCAFLYFHMFTYSLQQLAQFSVALHIFMYFGAFEYFESFTLLLHVRHFSVI